jgi:hypothetical protein
MLTARPRYIHRGDNTREKAFKTNVKQIRSMPRLNKACHDQQNLPTDSARANSDRNKNVNQYGECHAVKR